MPHILVWLLRHLPAVFKHMQEHQFSTDFSCKLLFYRIKHLVLRDILENSNEFAPYFDAFNLLGLPYTQAKIKLSVA